MLSEAMAIHHDQDDLEEQPDPEVVGFMHRVCVTWASWAYAEQDKLGVKAITRIWVIKPPMHKRALDLTDEQLETVDKKIAQLTSRERNMLHDEYLHRLPMWQKTRRYTWPFSICTMAVCALLYRSLKQQTGHRCARSVLFFVMPANGRTRPAAPAT